MQMPTAGAVPPQQPQTARVPTERTKLPEEKEQEPELYPVSNKEEGKCIFKDLLNEKSVSPNAEWEDVRNIHYIVNRCC